MANPNQSEKSNALDREENITKGNLAAKKVAVYQYDASTDTLQPGLREIAYKTHIDDSTTADVLYIGIALPGSSESSPVWQISKIDTSSGTKITWADGNASFDNVWGDPGDVAALTYN